MKPPFLGWYIPLEISSFLVAITGTVSPTHSAPGRAGPCRATVRLGIIDQLLEFWQVELGLRGGDRTGGTIATRSLRDV